MTGQGTTSPATATATATATPTPAAAGRRGGGLRRLLRRGTERSAVGLDVGSRGVKAVQLERSAAGGLRVVAAAERPRADGPDAAAASAPPDAAAGRAVTGGEAASLAAALAGDGFRGRGAVLAAPSDAVMIGSLDLPARTGTAPLDQIARVEVARNFRCPPASFELAWWELPGGGSRVKGTRALAVGLPHAQADALLDAFEQAAKLDVRAVDVGPAALVRACGPVLAPHGLTAILDLGDGPATLSLVCAGVLVFSRRIPEGAAGPLRVGLCRALAVDAEVADYLLTHVGLDVRPAEPRPPRAAGPDGTAADPGPAVEGELEDDDPIEMPDAGRRLVLGYVDTLVKELSLSFSYACNLYPDAAVAKLLLVGGGARLAGLAARLAAALTVEAVPVAPADLVECDPRALSACGSPALTLALGLAMHDAA